MELLPPRCAKKKLLLIAGTLWIIAGTMVAKLGLQVLINSSEDTLISLIVGIVTFYIFFNFIFKRLVYKHKNRIASKVKDNLCIFSFFDVKSYLIMIFMMGLGITIRSINTINPMCWAAIYVGIGTALFVAGILFIIEWKKWN
ncbi:MAG: hypothetical protein ACRC3Y_17670 [Romboutsia sp.]|uniref:hypothetical protein n=1 Tax=Romboutsia sp. TaxID=1965302 RepID=UPI003F35A546